ncbi:MAG: glycosyltransferase [Okeania sp. SIO3B5]|uniref:glycosyltransferase n=1 Tax=Okeania sp. SIO3B5 TaxID=2607811 RepID=UPI0013FFC2CB|nr:glycosyltransferase [Okeania sp. SIO3B5]NEO52648.1 glycosyltransferase [Okeania sp. SIO3B5]
MHKILLITSFLNLIIWIYLLLFRGKFWLVDKQLLPIPETEIRKIQCWPSIAAVVPARNEAKLLRSTLKSLLNQDYPGNFKIILVDDNSKDNTANVAKFIAQQNDSCTKLEVISAGSLPSGWSGKLWAINQGIRYAKLQTPAPDYFLFTDADIEHSCTNIRQLIIKAEQDNLALVSLMVKLQCQTLTEELMIPAFVFFFQKLYPFRWVNNPRNSTAAAAGGCILIRNQVLDEIGGIEVIKNALIDDCSLATAVKQKSTNKKIWLGLTSDTRSKRSYPDLFSIWSMVARTAFTQLNYSPLLLIATIIGMKLTYLVPSLGIILGVIFSWWEIVAIALLGKILMFLAYLPIVRFYQLSPIYAMSLPTVASIYTLITINSAWRYWRGRGGYWKGRTYSPQKSKVKSQK